MKPGTFVDALQVFQRVLAATELSAAKGETLALQAGLDAALALFRQVRDTGRDVYLIGNGGSAALVAHVQNDLVNKTRLRAHVLHEPSLLTCMSNDYGYQHAYANLLDRFLRPGDLLVAVSSAGRSANIIEAVAVARAQGASVLTLSGFAAANPLRQLGDINIWLPSDDYGEVEVGHQLVLHYLSDALV